MFVFCLFVSFLAVSANLYVLRINICHILEHDVGFERTAYTARLCSGFRLEPVTFTQHETLPRHTFTEVIN